MGVTASRCLAVEFRMANYGYGNTGGWDSQSWSYALGWVFGIRVRVHLVFILMAVFTLLAALSGGYFYLALLFWVVVWVSVLLHEFGHCFGCRAVGGQADDILLWPLGGLAFCLPPHHPTAHLFTVMAGPAVNVVLCFLSLPFILIFGIAPWTRILNPLDLLSASTGPELIAYYIFKINYMLFLFNVLLPFYPMDGGRILQALLWYQVGYFRSTLIATSLGMVGGIILCAISLYMRDLNLAFLGVFGFLQSWLKRRELEMSGPHLESEFGYDFSEGYTSLERSFPTTQRRERGPSLRARFAAWRERRRAAQLAKLEAELDRILEKIHQFGMGALSRTEKRILNEASKKRRRLPPYNS